MSDQKPREFYITALTHEVSWQPQYKTDIHVIEANEKTLAAEEMYEALEDLHSFLVSGDAPGGINAAQRIEHVLAKAGKR